MRARAGFLLLAMLAALVSVAVTGRPAQAHPLGNFSVNQLAGLDLRPDRVDVAAVVDLAELPTLQDRSRADRDGNNTLDAAEQGRYAQEVCAELARGVDVTVADARLTWRVTGARVGYVRGSAGLTTTRLTCQLTAPARLRAATTVRVTNRFRTDRVGWRELTAVGNGIRLLDSPLPTRSVSDGLRTYPKDLLSSPRDVRSALLRVEPDGGARPSQSEQATDQVGGGTGSGPTEWTARAEDTLRNLTASHRLTPLVGVLAVLLALTLGAGHAVLPGHGKTAIAIALAGRSGRKRDALVVAGTVTLTHTGGVLLLGLVLSTATAVAGESVLGWLGVASGTLVAVVGVTMLVAARRRRQGHGITHDGHAHAHGHGHAHDDHGHAHRPDDHGHDDHGHDGHGHDAQGRHHHGHGHHHASPAKGGPGRLALVGMGVAGGLVPSPSALIILLGAVGLGRTVFGITLVVSYGLGMAATLTAAGLALLVLRDRLSARAAPSARALLARLSASAPTVTAALVLVVGCGLGARALVTLGAV